jgi:hypothetical protein
MPSSPLAGSSIRCRQRRGKRGAHLAFQHHALDPKLIEGNYQVAGFAGSTLTIWIVTRHEWPEAVNTGITFTALFLHTKFHDGCWEVMPNSASANGPCPTAATVTRKTATWHRLMPVNRCRNLGLPLATTLTDTW